MVEFNVAVVLCCAGIGGVFLWLWMIHDRRDHRVFEQERRKRVFHCVRCNAVYATRPGPELVACPRCGHENAKLRF